MEDTGRRKKINMLDKIEKYIVINDEKIYVSQNSSGMWKCDKLPCCDTDDVKNKIGIMNKILNDANKPNKIIKERKVAQKKEKKPEVKGLQ